MPEESPESWEQIVARFARFSGVVGEVHDPLTWGLDLEEETVTGVADGQDPTEERFLRAYRTFSGESVEVETLRIPAEAEQVEDIVRAACSGALAAPLHADVDSETPEPTDFAEAYQDYRTAMRAIVAEVDEVPCETSAFRVDGMERESLRVTVRGITAVYAPTSDRALVVTGPGDLVDRVDIVTRPIRNLLHGDDGPRF
ncbi:hypothetical protein L1785_00935 [Antribacter sp. KLBMP9083]|uniref:Uncharacterized protein n=1 Tax=Antribacter soli TaxID=2910976 RepID=A0AA41QAH1_9MICO|nr:hypothetical protein [Antribacter soli]MCF4119542.1 hypothetical protein [Antribacter soli]